MSGRFATWRRARTCPTTSSGSSSPTPSGARTARASSTDGSPSPSPGQDLKGANYDQKVYYHRLGTLQQDDALVWEDPEHKEWRANPTVTDDGSYLILTIEKGTDNKYRVVYRPLDQPEQKPMHLVGEFDADYTFIDNDGPVFWFRTDKNAPRGKVVAIDIRNPEPEHWVELIPEQAETLEGVGRGRRPVPRPISERRSHGRSRVRPVREAPARRRSPRPRHGRRLRGQAQRQGNLLRIHVIHEPADHLSVRCGHRGEHALAAAQAQVQPAGL